MRSPVAGKARVHELAKELGVESKAVLAKLKEMGEFVKSASSTVEAPVARRLRAALEAGMAPAAARAPAAPTPAAPAGEPRVAARPAPPRKAAPATKAAPVVPVAPPVGQAAGAPGIGAAA